MQSASAKARRAPANPTPRPADRRPGQEPTPDSPLHISLGGLQEAGDHSGDPSPRLGNQAALRALDADPTTAEASAGNATVLQLMAFARFQGLRRLTNWFYSEPEQELLDKERRLGELVDAMAPYQETEYGEQIQAIDNRYRTIRGSTYDTDDYGEISAELTRLFYRLDGISTRLAAEQFRFLQRYGEGNEDLMDLSQKRDKGEHAGALLPVILGTLDRLPAPMRIPKNQVLVKKALHPDIHSLGFGPYLRGRDVEFAEKRADLILGNLRQLTDRVGEDWERLQAAFGLEGDLKSIELTGSDFHNLGQQVAILESTGGQKAVYKPRTVAPDRALSGEEGGAFAALNQLDEGALDLPTMRYLPTMDWSGEYGYARFVEQKPEKSPAEIRTYYRRLAQTLVAAKLLGVNDLHQENVMATEDEPTIIDAETAFLPYVMTARRMTATGVRSALTSFRSMETQELENNYFVTPEEHEAWQNLSPEEKEQRRLVTYSDYITERRRNDLAGERNYVDSFVEGLQTVLGVIDDNQDEIVDRVRDRMKGLKMARVVPFNTMEFTGAIRDYHDWLRWGEPDRSRQILAGKVDQALQSFDNKGFELVGGARPTLLEQMEWDFDNRDTPVFHFNPGSNNLTYHGLPIGRHPAMDDPEQVVRDNVEWLAGLTPEEILEDLGLGGD